MTRFIEIDAQRVPAGAHAETFIASDGAALRAAYFPTENARGAVIALGGWSEFIEKYFEVAEDLRARGFHVAMMDWRGQGLSTRVTAWPGYFDRLTDDLCEFAAGPVCARFGERIVLLTHSMGGLPALMLLARERDLFERAILSAPLTRMFKPAANALVHGASAIAARVGLAELPAANVGKDANAFEGNMFTTDPARHETFRNLKLAAPEAALNAPVLGWVAEAARASAAIHAPGYFDAMRTPTLIVSAGEERRIDGDDHLKIADASPYIAHARIDGALHEILMESDPYRDEFWRLFDRFVDVETD